MKRPEPTARTLKRQERTEARNFLLLLLLIVGVVAVIQVLLFLTMTHIGTGSGHILQHVRRLPSSIVERSVTT
jgi:hypothetical protein